MANDELLETAKRIETATKALVMLLAQREQAADPSSRVDQQSVEAVLYLSGFTQKEIGGLLNKTQQSVHQKLKAEGVR